MWGMTRRAWVWVTLGGVACLVGLSFYLDTVLPGYIERAMNQRLTGYTIRIRAVSVHPVGFSLDLLDMTVVQDQHPDPPVLHIPRLHASVDWGALLDRRLVANFFVQRPKAYVNLAQARAELQDKTALRERGWQEALESIYPLKINGFRVEDGEVVYVDRGPFRPLQLSRVQLRADNIRNVRSPAHVYPSPVHLDAVVFDSGKVVLDGNANFLAEPHVGLRASFSLDGVALDYFQPITERYNVAVRGGVLSSSGAAEYAPTAKTVHLHAVSIRGVDLEYVHTPETAAAETQTAAQIRAAAREVANHPECLLRVDDVEILRSTLTFRNRAADTPWLMAAAAWILTNRDRGEVATKVNLSGPLDSPQFSTWEALGGFLENAFVRAILPGFEGEDRSGNG